MSVIIHFYFYTVALGVIHGGGYPFREIASVGPQAHIQERDQTFLFV